MLESKLDPNLVEAIRSNAYSQKEEKWGELLPLPALQLSTPSLSPDLIPANFRDWVVDVAQRMSVPNEFICVPALVAFSSLIGHKIHMNPKQSDDWVVAPFLWGAAVARPGKKKSAAISAAIKPLTEIQKRANKHFEEIRHSLTAKMAMLEADKKRVIKQMEAQEKEDAPSKAPLVDILSSIEEEIAKIRTGPVRYILNDSTVEKMIEIMKQNPNGQLVVRDELAALLNNFQREGRESDREFYLEAWGGLGSFTMDRISRGTLHLEKVGLSLMGGIQEGKLRKHVVAAKDGGAGDDGLLQRLQLAICPTYFPKGIVDRPPHQVASQEVQKIFDLVDKVEPQERKPFIVRFNQKAQPIYDKWANSLEERLASKEFDETFESHIAKYRSLVPSLSLIFQMISSIQSGVPEFINDESLNMAILWSEFLEAHAKRIYSASLDQNLHCAYALKNKIEDKKILDGDSVRSIYQHHWTNLDTQAKVEMGLSVLRLCGWVKIEEVRGPIGAPSSSVRIHPSLR